MILYRPVGTSELELIKESGYTSFPPRLSEQPIFYPVLNEEYACEIAEKWNTKTNDGKGYVTRFAVDDDYIAQFEVHTVGNHCSSRALGSSRRIESIQPAYHWCD